MKALLIVIAKTIGCLFVSGIFSLTLFTGDIGSVSGLADTKNEQWLYFGLVWAIAFAVFMWLCFAPTKRAQLEVTPARSSASEGGRLETD